MLEIDICCRLIYVYFAFITHDDRLKNSDVYYSAINLLVEMYLVLIAR